jgi:cell division protein FtsZ
MVIGAEDVDNLKYEIEEESRPGARIKVIGVGGGGCNAVARLVRDGLGGVEFYAMDTDAQALSACVAPHKLQLGAKLTKGLGAGSDASCGREAALENTDDIVEALQGSDMVFVAAGLGGGTGTGALPVIASLAKELDALTVAVVTRPFAFEGPHREAMAREGLETLAACVDAVMTIPNDRLLALVPAGASFFDAFKAADDMLRQAVEGVSDIINSTGAINRDFSDIKAAMTGMGYAMIGTATASGEGAAVEAARQAINCPLLEDTRIAGARRVLVNITGSNKLGFHQVNDACTLVREAAHSPELRLNFGVIMDESMGDSVKVTVIATGVRQENAAAAQPEAAVAENLLPPAPVPAEAAPPEQAAAAAEEPEAETGSAGDPEDLDTPAYLRQSRPN